ncbi:hypothetical protein RhiirC2_804749, partial [Rhizophagus irregularis]
ETQETQESKEAVARKGVESSGEMYGEGKWNGITKFEHKDQNESRAKEDEGGSQFQQSIAVNSVTKKSGKEINGVAERNLSR